MAGLESDPQFLKEHRCGIYPTERLSVLGLPPRQTVALPAASTANTWARIYSSPQSPGAALSTGMRELPPHTPPAGSGRQDAGICRKYPTPPGRPPRLATDEGVLSVTAVRACSADQEALPLAMRTPNEFALRPGKKVDHQTQNASEHHKEHPKNRTVHSAALSVPGNPY